MSERRPARARSPTTSVFGSKAVGLGEPSATGCPVPPGFALSGPIVEAVAAGDEAARSSEVVGTVRPLGGPLAVRSSAVDEDGADASFAGQHLTLLNVPTVDALQRGAARDLVVRELGLGDHLPEARRAVHAAERRRSSCRPARPGHRRRDVHAETR